MVRVFIAVNVPDLSVPGSAPANPRAPPHFTLRFFSEVSSEDLDRLRAAMTHAVEGMPSFTVELVGVGAFPNAARPRVVWVGVRAGREQLSALAQRLTDELSRSGWPPEPRGFAPHLTLLRVTGHRDVAEARRLLDFGPDRLFGVVSVEEVLLRESVLGRAGAVHTTIGTARLGRLANPPPPPDGPPPTDATGTK